MLPNEIIEEAIKGIVLHEKWIECTIDEYQSHRVTSSIRRNRRLGIHHTVPEIINDKENLKPVCPPKPRKPRRKWIF